MVVPRSLATQARSCLVADIGEARLTSPLASRLVGVLRDRQHASEFELRIALQPAYDTRCYPKAAIVLPTKDPVLKKCRLLVHLMQSVTYPSSGGRNKGALKRCVR